jgi:hypothetical protein
MKGSRGQSYSTAGSWPSSTPNQRSTSGPRAWWKSTTETSGTKLCLVLFSVVGVGGTDMAARGANLP